MTKCSRCGSPLTESSVVCDPCRKVGSRRWGQPPEQEPTGAAGLIPSAWIATTRIGRHPSPTPRRPSEVHWLVPPIGEPIELDARAGAALVLGRGDDCELRVSSPTVSRRHAEISFRGAPPRAWIRDLEAVNRTLVNGKPVKSPSALADGDVIRLGDITAVYRVAAVGRVARARPSSDHLDATIPIAADARRAPGGFSGDVSLFPMPDLIGRLTLLRATGTLVVDVDGLSGHARFDGGALREASFAGERGEAALLTIASLTRGRLRFDPR